MSPFSAVSAHGLTSCKHLHNKRPASSIDHAGPISLIIKHLLKGMLIPSKKHAEQINLNSQNSYVRCRLVQVNPHKSPLWTPYKPNRDYCYQLWEDPHCH